MKTPLFIFENKGLAQQFVCAICLDVLNRPYSDPCGHSFCQACIFEWVNEHNFCPISRRRLGIHDLRRTLGIRNTISGPNQTNST